MRLPRLDGGGVILKVFEIGEQRAPGEFVGRLPHALGDCGELPFEFGGEGNLEHSATIAQSSKRANLSPGQDAKPYKLPQSRLSCLGFRGGMMSWRMLQPTVERASDAAIAEVAMRAAIRSLPISVEYLTKLPSKAAQIAYMLTLLRGLIAADAAKRTLSDEVISAGVNALAEIDTAVGSFQYSLRCVRAALNAALPSRRSEKIESLRQSLQSISDHDQNRLILKRREFQTDFWNIARDELNTIHLGARLSPPISHDDIASDEADRLFAILKSFDERWHVWIIWLRYIMFGQSADEVPNVVWPVVSDVVASFPSFVWKAGDLKINSSFASTIIEVVEQALDAEASRPQTRYVPNFEIKGDVIAIQEVDSEPVSVRKSILQETIRATSAVADLPATNSNSRIIDLAKEYLENTGEFAWNDDAVLVLRGDALRKELAFQHDWTEDSDIPAITSSALRTLEQAVRNHNLLVNTHEPLKSLDRMLSSFSDNQIESSETSLKSLITGAEARMALERQTIKALEATTKIRIDTLSERNAALAQISLVIQNLVRAVFSFLWLQRKAIGSAAVTVPPAVYALGKWALANQQVILNYYQPGTPMSSLLHTVFQWLSKLPLL